MGIETSPVTNQTTTTQERVPTVSDLVRSERTRLGSVAHDEGSVDGEDTTRLGEAVQDLFGTQEFLDAGKATGKWFTLPKDTERAILEIADAEDGDSIVKTLRGVMNALNDILARGDLTDDEKVTFLSTMLGELTGDYDDTGVENPWKGLGIVLAQVLAGDVGALFNAEDMEADELKAMTTSFTAAISEHLTGQEIDVKPDDSAVYFAGREERMLERQRLRSNMTADEVHEDFNRERREKETARAEERQRLAAGRQNQLA